MKSRILTFFLLVLIFVSCRKDETVVMIDYSDEIAGSYCGTHTTNNITGPFCTQIYDGGLNTVILDTFPTWPNTVTINAFDTTLTIPEQLYYFAAISNGGAAWGHHIVKLEGHGQYFPQENRITLSYWNEFNYGGTSGFTNDGHGTIEITKQ